VGYLRLWLAVSVMFAHYGLPAGARVVNGGSDVRCFFVLSGYVIALVLDGRYRDRIGLYLKLRLLRIFPAYYAALALTIAAWSVVWFGWGLPRGPVAFWAQHPPDAWGCILLVLQHVFLIGMEWFSRFNLGAQRQLDYLMLPPAWTLSVELCFYLVAPWLLKASDRLLWLSVAVTLLIKAFVDPASNWGAPLLPMELGYFSLGVLGWRWQRGRDIPALKSWLLLAATGLAFLGLPYVFTTQSGQDLLAPVIAALALPCLHRVGQAWRWDRQAGEVSYALYLLHPLTGLMLAMVLKGAGPWPRALALAVGSLCAAIVFWRVVEEPVTRLRRRLSE
jgi:peptidoglycan/LPS O-acetylase OafA/YrhL